MHIGWTNQPGGFVSIIEKPPKELEHFKLLKSWESTGYFWCLKDISKKLHGRIFFKAGHSVKLFLDGSFEPNLHNARGIDFGIIHGQLFNGIECSLFNSFGYVEVFMADISYYRTEITGDLLILGFHYQTKKEIIFSTIDFVCFGMNDWFKCPFQLDYKNNNWDDCRVLFNPDNLSVNLLHKNIEFKLYTFCNRSIPSGRSAKGLEFKYQYHIHIEPKNPQNFEWFFEVLVIFKDFFTFITGLEAYTLDIKGFYPNISEKKDKFMNEIDVFFPVVIPKILNSDSDYKTTFYKDIKDKIQDIMNNWFLQYDKIKIITSTYRKILHEGQSVRNVFMQVVQILEHFHGVIFPNEGNYLPKREWKNFIAWLTENLPGCLFFSKDCKDEQMLNIIIQRISSSLNKLSLRSRLKQIIDSVSRVELMPLINNPNDPEKAINDLLINIENTRNFFTHYDEKLKEKQINEEELMDVTSICWAILTYVLAKKIGFDDKYSGHMAHNSKMAMFLISRQVDL